ncbi:MAG TPA: glycosyltransferase family 2 protein [Terriglobales bacterium]|nr:glycosyltransferase family 2 protein [Terriglobales bacterium]
MIPANPPTTGMDVSVLVPVYNNAETIAELLDRILAVLSPRAISFEVVIVDDGSQDDSLGILQARAAADARLRVFALTRNFGSQAASCAACDLARGRRIVHIDADLENFPEDIPLLLDKMEEGFDFVLGYRVERKSPWLTRRLPSRLLNRYIRRQTKIPIRDAGCGLCGLDARLIRNLEAEGEARRLMKPMLLRRARRITEVPVRHRASAKTSGHSMLWLLGIAADYYMLTARRPFLITGLVAGIVLAAGTVLICAGAAGAGLISIGVAALAMLLSLIGEYVQRLYHLAQARPFYELADRHPSARPGASAEA